MRSLLFALALTSVSLGYRPEADACINETLYTLDDATRLLAEAETLLAKGRYAQALMKASNTVVKGAAGYNWNRGINKEAGKKAELRRPLLEARKQRVIAIARLRLGDAKKARPALAALLKTTPDDPELEARYAEALIATGDTAGGSAILVDLQKRDLMPDAAGWLALAKVYDGANDAAARDRAITGCKAMAPSAKTCALTAQPATKPKAAKPVAKS